MKYQPFIWEQRSRYKKHFFPACRLDLVQKQRPYCSYGLNTKGCLGGKGRLTNIHDNESNVKRIVIV